MIDTATIVSNIISGILLSIIAFLVTNSRIGILIISKIKKGVNESNKTEETELQLREEEEIKNEEHSLEHSKTVRSKNYQEPRGYDVSTFYTIESRDLYDYNSINFIIRDQVEDSYIYFKIDTSFLKQHMPEGFLNQSHKKIHIYIRKKEGTADFTIERLGKKIEPLSVNKYKRIFNN